ncbi:hypothetical protein [Microbacterium sp.]|nr:hypothetical protein [Microbacterium sp.]MDP3951330.1 hypothetical protein [Microbacterium sp.]
MALITYRTSILKVAQRQLGKDSEFLQRLAQRQLRRSLSSGSLLRLP